MQTICGSTLGAGAALALFTAATALADTGPTGGHVFGYQDSRTGTFHALRQAVPETTTAPTTGTVEVTMNIKLVSTFAKSTTIGCSIDLTGSVTSETTFTGTSYEETAGSTATISGSTATCTATIPYSWLIPAASGAEVESFAGNYTVSAYAATNSAASILASASRSSGSSFVSLKTIPASGTVSKYTINVTL